MLKNLSNVKLGHIGFGHIGQFLIVLGDIISSKSSPNYWQPRVRLKPKFQLAGNSAKS